MGNINDSFYTTGGPKGSEGLKGVLEAVGNAVAGEYGLRAPGATEEAEGRATEILGRRLEHELDDSFRLVDKKAKALIGKAGAYGLHVNFEAGENGNIVRTEEVERRERVGIATEVGLKHSYEVRGYASHRQPLARNIDRLTNLENVERVIKENGKAETVYELLGELMSYQPHPLLTSNAERVLGLNDDHLYSDLRSMMHAEYGKMQEAIANSKSAKLAGSRCRPLKWVGSTLVESKMEKLAEWKETKNNHILALETRFAYKQTMALVASEIDGKIPVLVSGEGAAVMAHMMHGHAPEGDIVKGGKPSVGYPEI